MRINIKATGLELTPPLKEYIEEKIGGLGKYTSKLESEKALEIEVFVEVGRSTRHHHKGLVYYAEANFELPGGMLRASNEETDIRAAVDGLKDKLREEIIKYKETGKTK